MMNIFFLVLVLLSGLGYSSQKEISDKKHQKRNRNYAVTYDLAGGRLGDQFLGYLHAKWISYRYDIPLLYKPFSYSKYLVLHEEEECFESSKDLLLKYRNIIRPSFGQVIDYENIQSTIYVIPYFPESLSEIEGGEHYYFEVDWKDEGFRQELKRLIRPIVPIPPFLDLPKDKISVAVHIRKGGGFDLDDTWKPYPMKFANDAYYIEQIERIYQLFSGKPLYVYLFTDDQNPGKLVEKYKSFLTGLDIEFGCREKGNHHAANVLEDFFEMTRFDCLIRAESNFSIVASKIADYKVEISPSHYVQLGTTLDDVYIDEVNIEISKDFLRDFEDKLEIINAN